MQSSKITEQIHTNKVIYPGASLRFTAMVSEQLLGTKLTWSMIWPVSVSAHINYPAFYAKVGACVLDRPLKKAFTPRFAHEKTTIRELDSITDPFYLSPTGINYARQFENSS